MTPALRLLTILLLPPLLILRDFGLTDFKMSSFLIFDTFHFNTSLL